MSSEPKNPGTPEPQANDVELAEKLIQAYERNESTLAGRGHVADGAGDGRDGSRD